MDDSGNALIFCASLLILFSLALAEKMSAQAFKRFYIFTN